ncbi:MAG: hypothetical protein PHG66_05010 [Candidatus Colwellbacteria bacterium]|nr:hypothetical protein [Candidatus Colwellbacteria bacterium]
MDKEDCCDLCPECGAEMKDGQCVACGLLAADCSRDEAGICSCCGNKAEDCDC